MAGKGMMDDFDEFFLDDNNLRTPPHRPDHITQNGDYLRPADPMHSNNEALLNAATSQHHNCQQQQQHPQHQQQEPQAETAAVPPPHNDLSLTNGFSSSQKTEAESTKEDRMAAETETAVFQMIASEANGGLELIPDEPTSSSASRNKVVELHPIAANVSRSSQAVETDHIEDPVVADNIKTVSKINAPSTKEQMSFLFSAANKGTHANTVEDIELDLFGELLVVKNERAAAQQVLERKNNLNKTEASTKVVHVDLARQKEKSEAANSVFGKQLLGGNPSGDQTKKTDKYGLDAEIEIKEKNTAEPEIEEVRIDSPPDIETPKANNSKAVKSVLDGKKSDLTDKSSSSQCDNSKAVVPYKPKLQFNCSEIMKIYSSDGKPTDQIVLKLRAKFPPKEKTDSQLSSEKPVVIHQNDTFKENSCNTIKHAKKTGFCKTEKVEEVRSPINEDCVTNHKNGRAAQQKEVDVDNSKAVVLYKKFDFGQKHSQALNENLSKKEKKKISKNYENGNVQTEPIKQNKQDDLKVVTRENDNKVGSDSSRHSKKERKEESTKKKSRDKKRWREDSPFEIKLWKEDSVNRPLEWKKDTKRGMKEWNREISNHKETWQKEKRSLFGKLPTDEQSPALQEDKSQSVEDSSCKEKKSKEDGSVSELKADVVKPHKDENSNEKPKKLKIKISGKEEKTERASMKGHKSLGSKSSSHEDYKSKSKWKKSSFKEQKEFRKKKAHKPKRRRVYIEEDLEEEENERKRQEMEKQKKENEKKEDVWTEEDEKALEAFMSLCEPDEPGYGMVPLLHHSMSAVGAQDTKSDDDNETAHKKRRLTTIDDSPFKALLTMDESELSELLFVIPEMDVTSFERLDVRRYEKLYNGYESPAPSMQLEPLIIMALECADEGKAMKGSIVEHIITNHHFPVPIRKVDKLLGKCLAQMVIHSLIFQPNATGLRGFFFLDDPRFGYRLPAGTYGYGPGR